MAAAFGVTLARPGRIMGGEHARHPSVAIGAGADLALPPVPVPDCAAAYRKSKRDSAVAFCQAQKRSDADRVSQEMVRRHDDDRSPSVVGYEIEALAMASGQIVEHTGGTFACWPAD